MWKHNLYLQLAWLKKNKGLKLFRRTYSPLGIILGASLFISSLNGAFSSNVSPDESMIRLQPLARWSNVSGSLVESGQRGLGGGIEYSIAPDFCSNIIPLFYWDHPKPTCAQLKETLRKVLGRWAEGNPALRFVDVTDKIAAQTEISITAQTEMSIDESDFHIQEGAEIDFFALPHDPEMEPASGYAALRTIDVHPVGTNYQYMPGQTFTSVDIVFDLNSCFFFHPNGGNTCWYFENVALHEIGHALGLQHSGEYPEDFWTINDDSLDQVEVNGCKFPPPEQARRFDSNTVMSKRGNRVFELSQSDIAIRDFLYPICD